MVSLVPHHQCLAGGEPQVRDPVDRLGPQRGGQEDPAVVETERHGGESEKLGVAARRKVGLGGVDGDRSAHRADGRSVRAPDENLGALERAELPTDERTVILVDRREERRLVEQDPDRA